jgi:hypothetical protein
MLDLNRIANRLLNADRPEAIRGIDLYELQAGGFLQKESHRSLVRKYCAMIQVAGNFRTSVFLVTKTRIRVCEAIGSIHSFIPYKNPR